jgi:hypothetical protein
MMRIRYWIAGAFVVVTAILAPAFANGSLSQCSSGHVCLWGNNDFQWKIADRVAGSGTITNLTGEANNQMDSWANRSGSYTACGFGGANGTGDRQEWGPNSNDNNVNVFNSDEVSSWRTRYGC